MNSIIHSLNIFAVWWTEILWAILWQSTLLILVAACIAWGLRRSAPFVRYWLWQIIAWKMIIMPVWIVSVPITGYERTVEPKKPNIVKQTNELPQKIKAIAPVPPRLGSTDQELTPAVESMDSAIARVTWRSWLVLLWGIFIAFQLFRIVNQRHQLSRLLHQSQRCDEPSLLALMDVFARDLNIRRVPVLLLTDIDMSPFIYGIWDPALVLSRRLANTLDNNQLCQVLAHELAHVKRRDLLWGWITTLTCTVYFFHPLVHWLAYRIHLERELACDQIAMQQCQTSAADYADTLIDVVGHASTPKLLRVKK